MKRRLLIIAGILLVLVAVAVIGAGNYFYNLAVNANVSKDFLDDSDHLGDTDTSGNREEYAAERAAQLAWADSVYIKRTIRSYDQLMLNGYYFENPTPGNRYAIVVHGYMSQGLDMVSSVRKFYDAGFTVLAPDCRGCGESEGEYVGMGWHDRLDMVQWINLLVAEHPDAEIVLYGVSMGGATVMMTAGESLPSNVKAIVEDCGYTSAEGIFTYQLKDLFGLPKFPVIQAASLVTKVRAGYYLGEASALEQVAKSKTPILFIHGDADRFVPFEMLDTLYNAATCAKEKYVVAGAAHGWAASVAGEQYWENVFRFVSQYT